MRLHSPQFERAVRRGVRQALRKSPALRKQRPRDHLRRQVNAVALGPFLLGGVLAFFVWQVGRHTHQPAAGLAILSLWAFMRVCSHARDFLGLLYTAGDLAALTHLPAAPATIIRWETWKFLRTSWKTLVELLGGLISWVICFEYSGPAVLLVPIALVGVWLTVIAFAVFLAGFFPRLPFALVPALAAVLGFCACVGWRLWDVLPYGPFLSLAPACNWLLPSGWPLLILRVPLGQVSWLAAALVIPWVGIFQGSRRAWLRLEATYDYEEAVHPTFADQIPGPERLPTGPGGDGAPGEAPAPTHGSVGPTAIAELILSRQFLVALPWPEQGWAEQKLWHWFTSREQALSEFIFPLGFSITAPWKRIYRNLLITLLVAFGAGIISPGFQQFVGAWGLFFNLVQALNRYASNGVAFQLIQSGGVNIPRYAAHGLGYLEIGRFLLKCSVVQLPFFLPYLLFPALALSHALQFPLDEGLLMGLKAAVILAASRWIFVMFSFSSGTNDSTIFRFSSLLLLGCMAACGLCYLGLGVAAVLWSPQYVACGSLVLAGLTSYGLYRVYGWFYHRNYFDLMNLPRS